ncbi:MAG: carbon-nitrogen hydrolase family protein [Pseudomonadota bacterium]
MKIGLIQLNVGPSPSENLPFLLSAISSCVGKGAEIVFTPEVTNCLETDVTRQKQVLQLEPDDIVLAALQDAAQTFGVWLQVGSLALKSGDADGRLANRGFLIDPNGIITARYDKIHMFDVQLSETEGFRESARYRPGKTVVLADGPGCKLGLSICYDLRFSYLYRTLAQAGAQILTVPAAFAQTTGEAHWHILLRARAIETGCFVVAPAQTGIHGGSEAALRQTYGHSLVVAPWGEVLLDMGTPPGDSVIDVDLSEVARARARVPAIDSDAEYSGP